MYGYTDLYEYERGQAGRNPARRFARYLRRQGFLPTRHFVDRFLQRALQSGRRFDPRTFRREFVHAPHFRQTRSGYATRIAVVRRLPILYRPGGWNGRQIVLVGVLPAGARPPVIRTRPPQFLGEVDYEQSAQHGSEYQRARQTFLKALPSDWRQPGFVTGWIKQERRRQERAARGRPSAWRAAGQGRSKAKEATLRAIVNDPAQSVTAKRWAKAQLGRLARGRQKLGALRAGQMVYQPHLRGIPGYDVGHPIGRIPGVHDPTKFRLEMARDNRRRPTIARKVARKLGHKGRKLRKFVRRYGETDMY